MTLRGHWPFFARILALMLLTTIGAKVGRVFVDGVPEGGYPLVTWLTLLRPEFLLAVGTILCGAGLLSIFKGQVARRAICAGFLGIVMLVVALEIVGLCHQIMVGDVGFGLEVLLYFLPRTLTMISVIASEAPWWLWIAVAAFIGLFPVALFTAKPWRRPAGYTPGWRRSAGCLLGGAGLVALAAMAPAYPSDGHVAGATTLTFASRVYDAWAEEMDDVDTAGFFSPLLALTKADAESGVKPPNVIIIVLESVRASATSLTGDFPTTPVLADLAGKGLVAERAYTTIPHTSKALVSIFCGVAPLPAVPVVESRPGNMPTQCLPGLLSRRGYRTAYFQSATGHYEGRGGLTANMGFEEFYPAEKLPAKGFERVNYFAFEDDVMLDPVERWVERDDGPFFLALLTGTSHHNYDTPSDFEMRRYAEQEGFNKYLNTVRYTDRFLGRLMARLEASGALGNTVVVVVGDHGEGFGEHGRWAHNTVIYDEGLRVPFLILAPGLEERRLEAPVSHLDIMPTVVDLLNLQPVDGNLDGVSLLEPVGQRRIMAHCWYNRHCMAVMDGRWKLIHHFESQPDQLFDVVADPGETQNLISRYTDRAADMKADLTAWRQVANMAWRRNIRGGRHFEDLTGVLKFRQVMLGGEEMP